MAYLDTLAVCYKQVEERIMTDIDAETMEAIEELDTIQPTSIEDVRQIVTDHSCKTLYWGSKSNKVLVDVMTANVICTVYDNIREDLKEHLLKDLTTSRESFSRLVTVCWKVIK
jgi:hypothetical protein